MTLVKDTSDLSTNQALISAYNIVHKEIKNIEAVISSISDISEEDRDYNNQLLNRLMILENRMNQLILNITSLRLKLVEESYQ